MAALKVEVYQKENVRPSSPTPESLRIHKLSLQDLIVGTFYSPFVFFYPYQSGAGRGGHDYDELKESLSKTLSILYPLAGRFKDGLTIECNDEGADFVRANVTNCDLAEFLRNPRHQHLWRLLPFDPYPKVIDPVRPLLAIQVNRFRCGGTAVGLCTWHGVADGGGMDGLCNTLAAINRGEEGSGGGLVVDHTPIFPPGNFKRNLEMPINIPKLEKYTAKRIIFSKQDIERIRNLNQSGSERRRRPSRVEALSAFIWAAVIRATLLVYPMLKTHMLVNFVNLRKKLNPPLPSQCLGNILHVIDTKWEVIQPALTSQSLVGRVMEAIDKVTTNYVTEMYTKGGFLRAILSGPKIDFNTSEAKALSISSLCKFPFDKVDFGWGKPIWIAMAHRHEGSAIFMDTEDGGIEVWIGLEGEIMCNLDKDMEFQAYVSFTHMAFESSSRLSSAL